jgi:hypothetical protein
VQAHGFVHGWPEALRKPPGTHHFAHGIALPIRDVLRRSIDQMTDIVQESRDHEAVRRATELREVCDLQRMLAHRYRLTKIRIPPPPA